MISLTKKQVIFQLHTNIPKERKMFITLELNIAGNKLDF